MSMANAKEAEAAAGYWLPSDFLTDDDFLIDKENFHNHLQPHSCFPQTHIDHLLQKLCAISTSPQSKLPNLCCAGAPNNGSLRGAQSQYGAVQIAKLKLNHANSSCPLPRNHAHVHKEAEISTSSAYLNTTFEITGARAVGGTGQVAWAPHQIPAQRSRSAHDCGGAAAKKKVCAGTGVFLPRRYDSICDSNAYLSSHRRRPAPGCLASPFQGRSSAQIHSSHSMHRAVESQPQLLEPKISRAFVLNHHLVLARRQALAQMQQRRPFLSAMAEGSSVIGHDSQRLPHDWTY